MGSAIGGAHCKVQGSHRSQDPKHQLQLAGEHPDLVTAVEVLGVGIVAVQPEPVLIAFDVEDLEVAVRVGFVRDASRYHCSSTRISFRDQELYFIQGPLTL